MRRCTPSLSTTTGRCPVSRDVYRNARELLSFADELNGRHRDDVWGRAEAKLISQKMNGLPILTALAILGCAPHVAQPSAAEDDANLDPPASSAPQSSFERPRAESAAASFAELAASKPAPVVDPAGFDGNRPCGMPEGLHQPDWPTRLEPTTAQDPSPLLPGTATLAVLPDTQYYIRCRNGHLRKQRTWIETERSNRNIRGVLTLGDLTESNTESEWQFFRDSLAPLDSTLPIVLALGNHDYGDGGTANHRVSLFEKYFQPSFTHPSRSLLETLEPSSLENALYSIAVGPAQLGVLVLEWSPRERTVKWANDILARHPKLRTIVVTHAFLYSDDTRYDYKTLHDKQAWNPLAYRTAAPHDILRSAHDGEMLWQELVKKHANVFLVLSGHVLNDGTGRLTSRGDQGNLVHQLLSNYQMLDEGGLGYLRLLEFLPDGRTLRVKTYSPSLGVFATALDQDFKLQIIPALWSSVK